MMKDRFGSLLVMIIKVLSLQSNVAMLAKTRFESPKIQKACFWRSQKRVQRKPERGKREIPTTHPFLQR